MERVRHHKESVVGGMVVAHARLLMADSGMDFLTLHVRDVVINTVTVPASPEVAGIAQAVIVGLLLRWSSRVG